MSDIATNVMTKVKKTVKLLSDPGVAPLNQAIELEERAPSQSATRLIYAICGLVLGAILWAGLARVDIVTNARGRITPATDNVAVQNLEGGVVSEILVAEGQRVKQGDVLIRLEPLDNGARVEQLEAKRAALMLANEGERAIAEGRAPKFDEVIDGFEAQKAEQISLYHARVQSFETQHMVLAAQVDQRKSEVSRLSSQVTIMGRDQQMVNEELTLRRSLFDQKLTTRDRYYSAQRDATDREKALLSTRDQLSAAKSQLAEFERKLTEFEATTRSDAQEAIAKNAIELSEINASLKNETARTGRLELTAPVDGIVMGLTVKAVNAVVKPGDSVMELVPTKDPLVILANVAPQDISQVKVGQEADIRVSAFDYATFGTLRGKVQQISAATFADPDGRPFYRVRVALEREYFGDNPKGRHVLPGMDVEVDLKSGTRSILGYVLKPVTRTWDTALREP